MHHQTLGSNIYYLRTRAASAVEKSTLKGTDGKLNAVAVTPLAAAAAGAEPILLPERAAPLACSLDDPTCEACQ